MGKSDEAHSVCIAISTGLEAHIRVFTRAFVSENVVLVAAVWLLYSLKYSDAARRSYGHGTTSISSFARSAAFESPAAAPGLPLVPVVGGAGNDLSASCALSFSQSSVQSKLPPTVFCFAIHSFVITIRGINSLTYSNLVTNASRSSKSTSTCISILALLRSLFWRMVMTRPLELPTPLCLTAPALPLIPPAALFVVFPPMLPPRVPKSGGAP